MILLKHTNPLKGRNWTLNKSMLYLIFVLILQTIFLGINLPDINAKIGTSITCDVSPPTITLGDGVTVSGEISPEVVGVEVWLNYSQSDGSIFIRKTVTSMKSNYLDFYRPDLAGTWSVIVFWAGNNEYEGATSLPQSFLVEELPSGTSSITCMTHSSSIILGDQIAIYGAISPGVSATVTINVSINDGVSWNTLTTVTSSSNGSYYYVWTPSQAGSCSIRSSWPGDDNLGGATSNEVNVIVHGAEEPDFSISVSPLSQSILSGQDATFTVTITSLYGFNHPVYFSVGNLPQGCIASFNPPSIIGNGSSTMIVKTETTIAPGTYTLLIIGENGEKIHTSSLELIAVTAGQTQCIIATAAYGSPIASEVLYMRHVRDDMIGSNEIGEKIVGGWNSFYYSWSPTIARMISNSKEMQTIMRVVLWPLVAIVHLTSFIYTVIQHVNPTLASVIAFLSAAFFSTTFYLVSPLLIIRTIARRRLFATATD